MARRLDDWLSNYLAFVKRTEPPATYHTWTALFLISSALQRKTWLDFGSLRAYPNIYVMLVGPAGRTRKSWAINYGRQILEGVTRVSISADCPTREALIRELAKSEAGQNTPDGQYIHHCSLSVMSAEFGVFLGQNDVKLISDLTDFYDCRDHWKKDTKTQGSDDIYGIYLSILGGITPEGIVTHLPQDAIGGGFTSRLITVVENSKDHSEPKPSLVEALRPDLIHDLDEMGSMIGPFHVGEECDKWFSEWYINEDEERKKVRVDSRIESYYERRGTTLLKLGMLISASESNDQEVRIGHLKRALVLLAAVEPRMAEAYSGVGRSAMAANVSEIRKLIDVHRKLTSAQLLRLTYRHLDHGAETLKLVLSTLISMGVIKKMTEKGMTYYVPNLDIDKEVGG